MQTFEIRLPEGIAAKLTEAAQSLGVSVEYLLQMCVEEKLARLEEDLLSATDYVLEKNAELYKRLA